MDALCCPPPSTARVTQMAPRAAPAPGAVAGGDSAEEPGYRPSSSSAPSTASPSPCSGARQSLFCHLPTIPGRFGGSSRGTSCRRERAPAPPSGPAQFSRAGRLGYLVRTDCGCRRGAGGRGGVCEGRCWRPARARALRALQPQLRPGGRGGGGRGLLVLPRLSPPLTRVEELSPAAPTLPIHLPPRPTSELAFWICSRFWSGESWTISREGSPGPSALGAGGADRASSGSQQLLLLLRFGLQGLASLGGGPHGNLPRGDAARTWLHGEDPPRLRETRTLPSSTRQGTFLKVEIGLQLPPDMNQTAGASNNVRCPPGKGHKVRDPRRRGWCGNLESRWRLQFAGEWTGAGLRIPSCRPLLSRGGGP